MRFRRYRNRKTEIKREERRWTSSMSRVYCSNNADTGTVSYTSLTYKASLALVAKVIATKLQEFSFSQRSPAVREVRANSRISLENLFSLIFLWEREFTPPLSSSFFFYVYSFCSIYCLPLATPTPSSVTSYHTTHPLYLRETFFFGGYSTLYMTNGACKAEKRLIPS